MASKTARPGRRLIVFGLVVAALYGGVALGGELEAQAGPRPAGRHRGSRWRRSTTNGQKRRRRRTSRRPRHHRPARQRQRCRRVRGRPPRASDNIVVEIPGPNRGEPRQHGEADRPAAVPARRRGRLRASRSPPPRRRPPERLGVPQRVARRRPARPARPSAASPPKASPSATPKGRAPSGGLIDTDASRRRPVHVAVGARRPRTPSASPLRRSASAAASSRRPPSGRPGRPAADVDGQPGHQVAPEVRDVHLPTGKKAAAPVNDDKTQPLVTCDEDGNKLLLSASLIEGTQLKSAPRPATRRTRCSGSST